MVSQPTPHINAALVELQADLPRIVKDRTAVVPTKTGGEYRYDFVDLTEISDQILPRLSKLGLAFCSRPTMDGPNFVLAYELLHVSGEEKGGTYLLKAGTPQEMGGQITYARRYALCAITGVAPAGDDDDAQTAQRAASRASTRERAATRPARPAAAAGSQEGPSRISAAQMGKMRAEFAKVGYGGQEHRDDVLRYCADVIGHEIASTTELTVAEARAVIDKVAKWAAQDEPPVVEP